MSKIVCDICGTSFSDEEELCPICGCAKGAGAALLGEDILTEELENNLEADQNIVPDFDKKISYVEEDDDDRDDEDEDCEICTNIVKNEQAFPLLMDYDCLISRDVASESIFASNLSVAQDDIGRDGKNIFHPRNVKIMPLKQYLESTQEGS